VPSGSSLPHVTPARLFTSAFVRVWLATFGAFASFGVILLALPLYVKDELDRGSVGVGLAVGAASITAVIFGPPSGRVADRRGRRMLVLAGAAVMIVCYFGLALEPSLPVVVGLRLLAGAGEAVYAVALFTVATDLAPVERRGEAMSLVTTASYLGLTIGPVVADFVLGDDRFSATWLVAAGFVLFAATAVLPVQETKPKSEHEAPAGWLPPRAALLPGLLVLLALLGFGGFVAFAALYAREIGFARPGLVFALFGVVVVLVRLFGRKLPDRLGGRQTLALCFVSLAVGLTTVGVWQTEPGLLVGTAIFALGQALSFPAAVLLAMQASHESERSAIVGGVTAFVDVALGLGAFTLGGVAAITGYAGVFLVGACFAAAGLVIVTRLRGAEAVALEEA
jgi:MFS family permease